MKFNEIFINQGKLNRSIEKVKNRVKWKLKTEGFEHARTLKR